MMKQITIGLLATAGLVGVLWVGAEQNDVRSNFLLLGPEWTASAANYRINANFPATAGTAGAQTAALQRAADNWCMQAGANFDFNLLGSTGVSVINVSDGTNAVFYGNGLNGGAALAVTSWSQNFGGTIFFQFDMLFYDITQGGVNDWTSTSGTPSFFESDIEGIGTHEFGHALGLDHETCDSQATMWPSAAGTGAQLRSLRPNDISGVLAIYGIDPTPCGTQPVPDPMSFNTVPFEIATDGSVLMSAVQAASANGVQYMFEVTSNNGSGANDSPWQSSTNYIDSGISPNASVGYRVRARDAGTLQETAPSPISTVITRANDPGMFVAGNETGTTFDIIDIVENGNPSFTGFAIEVDGMWVGVSGALQANPVYLPEFFWVNNVATVTGLAPAECYSVRVMARNSAGVTTGFGPTTTVKTGPLGDCAESSFGTDTFFVDGSAGGALREVTVPTNASWTMTISSPNPSGFGWYYLCLKVGGVGPGDEHDPGFGTGPLCFELRAFDVGDPSTIGVITSFASVPGGTAFGQGPPGSVTVTAPAIPIPFGPFVGQGLVEGPVAGTIAKTNAIIFNFANP